MPKSETFKAQILRHPGVKAHVLAKKLGCAVCTVHITRSKHRLKRDLSIVELVRRSLDHTFEDA